MMNDVEVLFTSSHLSLAAPSTWALHVFPSTLCRFCFTFERPGPLAPHRNRLPSILQSLFTHRTFDFLPSSPSFSHAVFMDTEEGEFIICGNVGSPEDVAFDTVVGVIEDFMISFDLEHVWQSVPSLHNVSDDHDQHAVYTSFLEKVDNELDMYVLAACPEYKSIEEIVSLLQNRQEDITEEVWAFVSEGCFDYETFMEQWREKRP
ncbi:hypothetical protein, conserved [Leishmania tarentolae]|uniref:ARF-like 2-binding protein n=1 Tax=Leishmania tarentolae TaxID=5689 RepID=A0A640KJS5_LEITA|nr:hypothetical protein, conserved [Leishmania tarentolae]